MNAETLNWQTIRRLSHAARRCGWEVRELREGLNKYAWGQRNAPGKESRWVWLSGPDHRGDWFSSILGGSEVVVRPSAQEALLAAFDRTEDAAVRAFVQPVFEQAGIFARKEERK